MTNQLQKLTDKDVRDIRDLWATREWTQVSLAQRFGVTTARVNQIVRGVLSDPPRAASDRRCRLTNGQVLAIRELWATGLWTQTWLARRFGVSQPQVSLIVRGGSR